MSQLIQSLNNVNITIIMLNIFLECCVESGLELNSSFAFSTEMRVLEYSSHNFLNRAFNQK